MDTNQEVETTQNQEGVNKRSEMYKSIAGNIVLLAGFIISASIAYVMHSLVGIGFMGIGILLTVMIGGNILSKERQLTTGEVRKAIAISCICVFFGLMAFGNTIKLNDSVIKEIIKNFWWIVITVIGFYFGGRSAEKIVESVTGKWSKSLEEKVADIKKDVDKVKNEKKGNADTIE